MRILVLDVGHTFARCIQSVFRGTRATGHSHWALLSIAPEQIRTRMPSTTVFMYPSPGPPAIFFDGIGHCITTPITNTFASFTLALHMLDTLNQSRLVDMVAVLPFGDHTYHTALSMHAAFCKSKSVATAEIKNL